MWLTRENSLFLYGLPVFSKCSALYWLYTSLNSRYLKETVASGYLAFTEQDLLEISAVLAKSILPPGPVYGLERDTLGPHGKIMRYNLNQVNKGQHLEELCRRHVWGVEGGGIMPSNNFFCLFLFL